MPPFFYLLLKDNPFYILRNIDLYAMWLHITILKIPWIIRSRFRMKKYGKTIRLEQLAKKDKKIGRT